MGQNFPEYVDMAIELLIDDSKTLEKYFGKTENILEFLNSSVFGNSDIENFVRARVARAFLYIAIENDREILQPNKRWNEIILGLFDEFLKGQFEYSLKVYDFYLLNIAAIDRKTRVITLYSPAIARFKSFLKSSEVVFLGYLRYLIRAHGDGTGEFFVFEPFFPVLWTEKEEFKVMVDSVKNSVSEAAPLINIILKAVDEINSSKVAFSVEDRERVYLEEHLKSTGQYY